MTRSDFHLSTQTLWLHLVDMCRITQRCVAYAIQALQQSNPDMVANARATVYEIQVLHSDTTDIAHDLLLMEKMSSGRDLRFVLSSILICDSLWAIHNAAVEIASETMRFWGNGGEFESTDFLWMGDGVSRLVECCTTSFIDGNIEPAEIVLSTDGLERELVSLFHDWYVTLEQTERSQAKHAFAIARNLSQIVHHSRELAHAVIFWLGNESSGTFTSQASSIEMTDQLTPASIKALEAAISSRY